MRVLQTHHVRKYVLVLGRSIAHVFLALLFLLAGSGAYAQNILVKGRVTNENGQPVPRVSVSIKGTSTGTTGDEQGSFQISAPSNGTLVISSVGFTEREISINGRTDISITLNSLAGDIGEVVVVGYGTQRRKDVTGAIVSVSEKALREVPVANLQQALQGRAAGLEVQRAGTTPGAGAQIRIRGIRSISGSNDPLFVVDGIPFEGSLNDINPDDVASIDILKDASATAIYGSRGANGVIIVTTKKGRNGETRVSYSGYYGISKVANKYPVFNAQEYQAMRNTSSWGAGYMPEEINGINLGRNTDWQDLMYETAMRTDHNITVAGGRDGSTFSLGGGYYKETAALPGQDFTRFAVRASIDAKVGKKIKVGLVSLNQLGVTNGSQFVNAGSMFPTLALSPLMPSHDSLGRIYLFPNGNIDDNNSATYNPLLLKNNKNSWVDRVRRITTNNSLYAEYQFYSDLKYRVNVGLSFRQQLNAQFQGSGDTARINYATHPSYFRGFQGNTASINNGESWGYTVENILQYDKEIAVKHRVGVTALYSIQENHSFNTFVRKDSITEDFVQFYHLGLSSVTPNAEVTGAESSWALISYMGRVNYAYDDKYLLTATYRRDGSSRLAPGNKWHNYAAVSTGWNIINERFTQSFLEKIKISQLKLRVGYGQTSNQAINPYEALGLVSNNYFNGNPPNNNYTIRYNYGPTIVTGYNVVTLPNPALDWEYTKTLNIGLDFGLLRNRITGAIEYYNAKTHNILYNVSLPASSGVAGNFLTNIGEMENKGMEFSVSSMNYQSRDGFTWSTDLNLFFNKNKILKLASGVNEDIASQLFVGYPMSAIYDYKKVGIWQTHEAALAATYGAVPGQLKLMDLSGPNGKPDSVINSTYDRSIIGDGDAKLQGGMTHRFAYKGFDLSTVFYARFGGTLISNLHQPIAAYLTIMDGRRNGIAVDYWTPNNPTNWFPMPQVSISPTQNAYSTLGYYKASFVKIRSINLGYTFQSPILKRLNAQSMRLYVTVDNVATLWSPFMKLTGVDPEGTGVGYQGVATGPGNIRNNARGNGTITIGPSTPPMRSFTVGANITL